MLVLLRNGLSHVCSRHVSSARNYNYNSNIRQLSVSSSLLSDILPSLAAHSSTISSSEQNKKHTMSLEQRKDMTRFIRHSLPTRSDQNVDWDSLRTQIKQRYNLPTQDFTRVAIPVVAHSDKAHIMTLFSMANWVRPEMANENNLTLLTYYFKLLVRVIVKGRDEFGINKTESERVIKKIFTTPPYGISDKELPRVIVIVREAIHELAASSVENCKMAINLWSIILNGVHRHEWSGFIIHPSKATFILFNQAYDKSLRDEANEMMILSHDIVGTTLLAENVEVVLKTLLRLDSKEESLKFFQLLKETDSVVDITFISEIKFLLERMGYECKIEDQNIACSVCGTNDEGDKLGRLSSLSGNEFKRLQACMFEYWNRKSALNVGAFEEFKYFLDKIGVKFDVVIDTLNMSVFIKQNKFGIVESGVINEMSWQNDFDEGMKNICKKYSHVLLIGKEYNQKRYLKFIQENPNRVYGFFNIPAHVDDDLYTIFAAIQHESTHYISNDFFRDVNADLKSQEKGEEQQLFKIWCKTRRVGLSEAMDEHLLDANDFYYVTHISNDNQAIHVPIKSSSSSGEKVSWCCAHHRHDHAF